MNIEEWMATKQLTDNQRSAGKELRNRGINTFSDAVFSIGEPALAIITSSIADPIAGLAGIGMTAFEGVARGTETIDSVRAALSYTPKTKGGKIGMNALAGAFAPVGELMSDAEDYLGNSTLEATGSPFLAAAAALLPAAISETNPLGKISKKAGKIGVDQVNTGTIISHKSPQSSPINISNKRTLEGGGDNIFHGIFASPGDVSEYGGKFNHRYIAKNIAKSGDADLDYDKSIATLKKEYPDLDDDALNSLYEITAEDGNIFDLSNNPLEEFGYEDLGEASWEAQRIRGKIASDQGYDAIQMDDEFGTSYLIPSGSSAKLLDIK